MKNATVRRADPVTRVTTSGPSIDADHAPEPGLRINLRPIMIGTSSLVAAGAPVQDDWTAQQILNGGGELRAATSAECEALAADVRRRDRLAPVPAPKPVPKPVELLPVPSADDAARMLAADPQRLARTGHELIEAAGAVLRGGGPPRAVDIQLTAWRNAIATVRGPEALILAIRGANEFREWAARGDLAAQRYFEEQRRGFAAPAVTSFNSHAFLCQLAGRGIAVAVSDGQLLARPIAALNETDRRILSDPAKRAAVIAAASEEFEEV